MSHFAFLQPEWPALFEAASKAEALALPDPRTSCFYARRSLELVVDWIYTHDSSLTTPYQTHLSALIHEPTFKRATGDAVFNKARVIVKLGNEAVHSARPVHQIDAVSAVRELFHVGYWLAHTYARRTKPASGLTFDQAALPKSSAVPAQTLAQIQALEARINEGQSAFAALQADKGALDDELKRLRDEIAAIKKANQAQPDSHDYSEALTRDLYIDLLLKEAGWRLDQPRDREFEVSGMPNGGGQGFVDYVLWGDDGKPLGLVEAKRTRRDSRIGQQQAKLYADCLERQFGQRPVIFYSNGYEHWLWDDAMYPPRQVQGFYKKAELELLVQRRTSRRLLADAPIDSAIVERFYQSRAIKRVGEAFERDKARKALLVMATGSGKTRTVIALVKQLMERNWAKRVLFLADRVALVNQSVNEFKRHLPESSPVNLVTDRHAQGRVYVSTYPTIMGLIDKTQDEERRFGVGHFDLVIIDEAHRSVFQKYRAIFEYFDSLLIGLTATPKDEVDKNTYGLFELESGVPTDAYPLDEAVKDKFLVPPKAVSVPLKFQREGIKYDDLSEDEKDQWDELDWEEEDGRPREVDPGALNKWLFNADTVDKVLEHLMTRGQKVAGGDRLGKTIIFAKNHDHAMFIAERFDKNYPKLRGDFARVIDFQVTYAQSLIDDFSKPAKGPHIAISVDMLDTGIDVPEVVNLVFFKLVRSKTKFWQMIGRGTRLCQDLFGPGQDKQFFYIFDFCQNLEFFSANPEATEGASGDSLGKRLFLSRLDLLGELDHRLPAISPFVLREAPARFGDASTDEHVRQDVADLLHLEVSSMNLDNFVVRARRRVVEKYAKPEAWVILPVQDRNELSTEIAGLPSELDPEAEESKRFDLLLLRLQLARLRSEPGFTRLRDQVKVLAGLLEENATIPMIRERLVLIQEIQSDEWWQDVTVPMLERVRVRLRALMTLIEKRQRKPIYTDFEDEIGAESQVGLPGLATPGADLERFRAKARAYLRAHQDHPVIAKLRHNQPLTRRDLAALEQILSDSGAGGIDQIQMAASESQGLGLFVRALVGLDREAATRAMTGFLADKSLGPNQIDFIKLVVDYLTEHGVMSPALLYETPFIDFHHAGPNGLFSSAKVDELMAVLEHVRTMATAA